MRLYPVYMLRVHSPILQSGSQPFRSLKIDRPSRLNASRRPSLLISSVALSMDVVCVLVNCLACMRGRSNAKETGFCTILMRPRPDSPKYGYIFE